MKSVVVIALLLGSAAPAFADSATSFHDGRWAMAIGEGRTEGTAASLVLAARAEMFIAAYQTADKARALALVAAAEKDLDAALAKAPTDPNVQIQKAIAIGYRAKLTRSPGLAKDTRKRMDAVRAAHPEMALAWAALGGWHGGAVATLGSFTAGLVLGAHASEVDPFFIKAIKLDPANPVHRSYYAITLLDLDKNNAAKAATLLQGIGQMPAHDAFDALARAQGVQLAASLKTGDAAAAQALARRLAAFGTIG